MGQALFLLLGQAEKEGGRAGEEEEEEEEEEKEEAGKNITIETLNDVASNGIGLFRVEDEEEKEKEKEE
ncbi:hypothetical protein M8J77_012990 [Diaphorina citri]|nr:hypothetical protein M8J77_012990 [Diaphorina citri]